MFKVQFVFFFFMVHIFFLSLEIFAYLKVTKIFSYVLF